VTAALTDRQIRTDVQMQAVARDGQVHLLFSEEDTQTKQLRPAYTANFLMPAGDALRFSTLLADLAFEADTGLKAAGPALKAELIERHRRTLTRRLEVVMNSQREQRTVSNHKLAKEMVEICLKEVLG
jgi:hypothetical protein